MMFFPLCLYFFPLRPCNNSSTFTDGVLGGKYGKREIKSYFSLWTQSFFGTVSAYSNWGKIYDIFSPCVFIFSLLDHAINCSTFTGGVLGEIFFPSVSMFSPCVYVFLPGHAAWYLLYLPS
jgi:hypothetical protein